MPRRSLEGVGEILCFVDHLASLEFHNADRVAGPSQIHDRIFSDSQAAGSEDSPDLEARGLAGMVAAQSLQIASAKDPLAGLRHSDRRTRKPPSAGPTQCESLAPPLVTFLHDARWNPLKPP